jgi:hypothetical protein
MTDVALGRERGGDGRKVFVQCPPTSLLRRFELRLLSFILRFPFIYTWIFYVESERMERLICFGCLLRRFFHRPAKYERLPLLPPASI